MSDLHLDRIGARIAYSAAGPQGIGQPVLAAHGLLSSRRAEDEDGLFDWSAVPAGGTALFRFDARGHGESTGRPVPEDWHWSNLAADLLEVLDLVSPGAPVDGIGVSMGSATLLWAATVAPERFRRLALVIPPTAWAGRKAQAEQYEQGAAFVEQRGKAAWERGVAALPTLPIIEAGGWRDAFDADVAEDLLPSVLRGAAGSDLPDEDGIAALRIETLLLPWAGDAGHPVATAERLAELLPNAMLEVATEPDQVRGWGERIVRYFAA